MKTNDRIEYIDMVRGICIIYMIFQLVKNRHFPKNVTLYLSFNQLFTIFAQNDMINKCYQNIS